MHDSDENTAAKRSTNTAAPFNIVWLIFFGLLIFSPSTLDDIWNWVQDLATVWEVLIWIVTLPYMLALAIWESDWQTWLRIVLVVLIAMVWTGMMNAPRSSERRD